MLLMQQQELSGSNGYIIPFNCFSLRKHNPNYTGYCMKVERDSDNAKMDVGFDVNGLIDTGSILSWSGSDSVYVREWYNQGLQNASMIGISTRARIVNSGVVDLENGLPIIRILNNYTSIYLNTGISPINSLYVNNDNSDFTEIIVGKNMETIGCVGDQSTYNRSTGYGHYRGTNKNQMRHNSSTVTYSGTSLVGGVQGIYCFNQSVNGNLSTLTLNGVDNTTPTAMVGLWLNIGVSILYDVQEVILYDFSANDVSATYQNELSAEVNAYWGVY